MALNFNNFSSQISQDMMDIWVAPLDGQGEPELFLKTPFSEASPQFSPDGRWMAYTSDQSGEEEVYVRPFPGPGGRWQISTEGGNSPRWSRDGSELFYRSENWVVAVSVSAEGESFRAGKPQRLFEGPYLSPGGVSEAFEVTPDGQRFILLRPSEQEAGSYNDVTFIFNWFEEIRQLTQQAGS